MASVEASALDWARVRRLPIFSDCSDEEFAGVMARSAVLHRGAGEVLIAEGHPGTDVFVLLEGEALVTSHGEQLASLSPGDLFGEMAAFDSGVRTATVTASTSVALLLIDPHSLADVIGTGTVAWKMLRTLSERLRLTQELPDWNTVAEKTVAYTLGAEEPERNRLIVQAEVWAPMADWLLDQIDVAVGARVIDVACGPLGIMHLLAQRVGPSGEVFGLDREPRMITMAREVAAERGLALNLVEGDAAAAPLPEGSFDLVHARTLLINIINPEEIIIGMKHLASPCGRIDHVRYERHADLLGLRSSTSGLGPTNRCVSNRLPPARTGLRNRSSPRPPAERGRTPERQHPRPRLQDPCRRRVPEAAHRRCRRRPTDHRRNRAL
jgi:SAM-dependent methyltransferase